MKDTRLYKVRRTSDGKYATRHHGFGGIRWGGSGTIWKGSGVMKRALRTSLQRFSLGGIEIVLCELKEVAVVERKDLKPINKK